MPFPLLGVKLVCTQPQENVSLSFMFTRPKPEHENMDVPNQWRILWLEYRTSKCACQCPQTKRGVHWRRHVCILTGHFGTCIDATTKNHVVVHTLGSNTHKILSVVRNHACYSPRSIKPYWSFHRGRLSLFFHSSSMDFQYLEHPTTRDGGYINTRTLSNEFLQVTEMVTRKWKQNVDWSTHFTRATEGHQRYQSKCTNVIQRNHNNTHNVSFSSLPHWESPQLEWSCNLSSVSVDVHEYLSNLFQRSPTNMSPQMGCVNHTLSPTYHVFRSSSKRHRIHMLPFMACISINWRWRGRIRIIGWLCKHHRHAPGYVPGKRPPRL